MITVAQIFQIGTVLITFTSAIAGLYLDPKTTSFVGASVLTAWNAIGAILTGQQSQATSVAAHIDEPNVKAIVVPAVSELEGLDPLVINSKADATLKEMAADTSIKKVIEPPKTGGKRS